MPDAKIKENPYSMVSIHEPHNYTLDELDELRKVIRDFWKEKVNYLVNIAGFLRKIQLHGLDQHQIRERLGDCRPGGLFSQGHNIFTSEMKVVKGYEKMLEKKHLFWDLTSTGRSEDKDFYHQVEQELHDNKGSSIGLAKSSFREFNFMISHDLLEILQLQMKVAWDLENVHTDWRDFVPALITFVNLVILETVAVSRFTEKRPMSFERREPLNQKEQVEGLISDLDHLINFLETLFRPLDPASTRYYRINEDHLKMYAERYAPFFEKVMKGALAHSRSIPVGGSIKKGLMHFYLEPVKILRDHLVEVWKKPVSKPTIYRHAPDVSGAQSPEWVQEVLEEAKKQPAMQPEKAPSSESLKPFALKAPSSGEMPSFGAKPSSQTLKPFKDEDKFSSYLGIPGSRMKVPFVIGDSVMLAESFFVILANLSADLVSGKISSAVFDSLVKKLPGGVIIRIQGKKNAESLLSGLRKSDKNASRLLGSFIFRPANDIDLHITSLAKRSFGPKAPNFYFTSQFAEFHKAVTFAPFGKADANFTSFSPIPASSGYDAEGAFVGMVADFCAQARELLR